MVAKAKVKRGRPRFEVSEKQWKLIEEMARVGCTMDEISRRTCIPRRTFSAAHLKEHYDQVAGIAWATTQYEVRKNQLDKAMSGQIVGSIWWGKQHLGQKDRPDVPEERGREFEIVVGAEQRLLEVLEKLARARG